MDIDWDPNRATSPQWWDDNYSIPSTASPITPASSLGDSPFMFPSYTDGQVAYDDYTFDDPLNLNGISDADIAAFMSPTDASPLAFPSSAPTNINAASYPYLNRQTTSATCSPQAFTRPLQPAQPAPHGTKRKAAADPPSPPRRKDSKGSSDTTPTAATPAEKPSNTNNNGTRLRTSARGAASSSKRAAGKTQAPARTPHHFTEKKYRDRLNDQFGRLLAALESSASREFADLGSEEDGGMAGRFLSKSAVLEMARHRLRALEKENEGLAREVERLAEILRVRHAV